MFDQLFFLGLALLIFWAMIPNKSKRPRKKASLHRRNIKQSQAMLAEIQQCKGRNRGQSIFYLLRYHLSPYEFEELLLTCLESYGVTIQRSRSYSGDGGVDGTFRYKSKTYAIQAKRYRSHINPKHVKEFSSLIANSSFSGGLFIHCGKTGGLSKAKKGTHISIVSGSLLIEFLELTASIDRLLPQPINQ